jgi:pSer/pThr/pTyr-binding forkhead associated (FHA) protein
MHPSALELFRRACGLQVPLVLECQDSERPDANRSDHRFEEPFVLVGRDRRSDLVLDHPSISKRHAWLQAIDGRVSCIDLQSRTGVLRDGEREPLARTWLAPGVRLGLGPFRIRWCGNQLADDSPSVDQCHPPCEPPSEERSLDDLPQASLDLPIRVGSGRSLWRPESALALLGRSESCQLVLTDNSVSRFHASLVRTPLGAWVIDLLAREGVWVNGVRVRWAWLEDGDALRIGQFTLILRYEAAPLALRRADVPLEAGALTRPQPDNRATLTSHPGSSGRSLAVRPKTRPSAPVRVPRMPPSGLAGSLAAANEAEWLPSELISPGQMMMWRQQMQMMESFHNDMILMVQMFVAMHREHLVSVRDELDRVQQLTSELSRLQRSLVEAPVKSAPGSPGPNSSTSPSRPRESPGATPTRRARGQSAPKPTRQDSVPGADGPRGSDEPSDRVTKRARVSSESARASGPSDAVELHGDLTKRIAELQRERQGYWQRILSVISK